MIYSPYATSQIAYVNGSIMGNFSQKQVAKVLSYKNKVKGYKKYKCSNNLCCNVKIIPHICKSKLCSSYGKKATAIWIAKQNNILSNTEWQHITFTMPYKLWYLFWLNRNLLN